MGKTCGAVLTAFLLVLALAQHAPLSVVAQGPSSSDVCSGVNCQQGTCEPALVGYSCKCQEGWENILEFPFLPCGIPKDCKINYTCDGQAGAPGPPPPAPTFALLNLTSFNPCTFSLCGFGQCVPHENPGLLTIPYSCVCDRGNSNVLNMSSGICLPDCNFEGSCSQLGLLLSKSPPPPQSIIIDPANAGLYPPGDAPGQAPSAGTRSKDVATFLVGATIGAAFWIWM